MFEELNFSLDTLIAIGVYIITASALYWKMRIDLSALNLEIAEIKCDRKEKWSKHDERQDKSDAYMDTILKSLNDLRVDIKELKTNLEWIKKKGE
jgi:hypothetical protein